MNLELWKVSGIVLNMDLILSSSVLDIASMITASMMFGIVTTSLYKIYASHPIVEALVNTTLVVLKNTEVVWQPFVNTSLILLKPFQPLIVALLDTTLRGMVILGFLLVSSIHQIARHTQYALTVAHGYGVNATTAILNVASALTDLTFSLATITRASAIFFVRSINGLSYVINSFDTVSGFLYRTFMEPQTLTWNDLANVAFPFMIVGSILGYLTYRFFHICVRPHTQDRKTEQLEVECTIPRRSVRLARKRALLTCSDLSFAASQEPPATTANL